MEVRTIGIAGAGRMGHSIALFAAMAGYHTAIHDLTGADLTKAINNIDNQLKKLVQKNVINEKQSAAVKERITLTSSFQKFDSADFVIESVTELLDVKSRVFAQLDNICRKDAIIVSNTSTFSISALASATQRPGQVAGMHFFLPPSKLVEIIWGRYTSNDTISIAKAVAGRMDRICVEVKKDSPGFIANRIYTPLFLEAFRVYEEGIASREEIDLAMKSSYLPVGPFELADIIGLDVIKNSLDYYQSKLGPSWNPPQSLKELVSAGRLGKKTGKGWYDY